MGVGQDAERGEEECRKEGRVCHIMHARLLTSRIEGRGCHGGEQ